MNLDMQLQQLLPQFKELQMKYGAPEFDPILGAGKVDSPYLCMVFMNPTGRNISAPKQWEGLKAPWLGTKHIWKMLHSLDFINDDLMNDIAETKADDFSHEMAIRIYETIASKGLYITNLAKCTQVDARPLPNSLFKEYLPLMYEELALIKPRRVITFGNQVSSILLKKPISVSRARTVAFPLILDNIVLSVYPTFYPVGQGMRNIGKAIEDVRWIMGQG